MYRKLLISIGLLGNIALLSYGSEPITTNSNMHPLAHSLSQKNQDDSFKYTQTSEYFISELIAMMFNTHPNIKMYQQMIKGAEAGVDGAMWSYFPTPTVGANYTTNNIDGTTVAIEQPLWTGGKLDAAYDMAIANKDASHFSLKENSYGLIETLLNTIQTYLKAKEDLVALHNGKARLARLEEMIVRREDSGVSSKADIELLRARIYQIDTSINVAKNKKAIAHSQLELLTGQTLEEDTLIFEKFTAYAFHSPETILKSNLTTHPSLEKVEAQIAYAKAERDKAKAAILPNVSIKAQKNFGSSSLYDNNKNENDTVVYLAIQATPGAGLSSLSSREMAEAKVMQLTQEKISKKQDLIDKTMSAYNNYTFANSRIDIQTNSIDASQNVFESYIRLFLTGKRQWLDLVSASRELTDNELAYNETKITRLIASYQLALLEGRFTPLMRFNHDNL